MVVSKTYDGAPISTTRIKVTFIASIRDIAHAGTLAGTGITLLAIATIANFSTFDVGLSPLSTLFGAAF